MGKLRRVIFFLFLAVYLGIAPFTVLYALGYIFSPAQQSLIPTGLISLSTAPENASVQVNGKEIKDKTPLVLRNLKPGQYEISLSLSGYHPWHRRVQVKPDRAFRFESILLFPLELSLETLTDFRIRKIWHVAGGRYLVIIPADASTALYLFDLEEKEFRLFNLPEGYTNAEVTKIAFHPDGDKALIFLTKGALSESFFAEFPEPVQLKPLDRFFDKSGIENLSWSKIRRAALFHLKGEVLQRTDIEKDRTTVIFNQPVRGFSVHRGNLYVLDPKGRFLELSEKGKVRDILLDDPKKAKLIFGPGKIDFHSIFFIENIPLFFVPENSFAFFLSKNGKLLSNKLPFLLDENVEEVALAKSHPRVAYRKGKELWVVDFEKEKEKTFFESGPTPRRIYAGLLPISSPIWAYEDRYLLFLEGNHLKIQNFEDEENITNLLSISSTASQFVLDSKRGYLYFVDPVENRLVSTKIPKEGIQLAPPILTELVDDLVGQGEASK